MVRPFISIVEYDRHPFLWGEVCEGDKCQERDKLRIEGTIAKLDMLCRQPKEMVKEYIAC